jgi:hypothetical protein
MYFCLHVRCPKFLSDNNQILVRGPNNKFQEIHPVGADLKHAHILKKSSWRSSEVGLLTANKCSAVAMDRVYDDRYQLTSTYVSSQGLIHGILGTMVLAAQTGRSNPSKGKKMLYSWAIYCFHLYWHRIMGRRKERICFSSIGGILR